MSDQLKELLLDEWFEKLKPFIDSGKLKEIAVQLNYERRNSGRRIIPEQGSRLLFRAFRETPYNNVKVVILGQDPYYSFEGDVPVFDGLAFSNGHSHYPSPSLVNILKEVEDTFSEGLSLPKSAQYDLTPWAGQGVLLINTAHSVVENKPESHLRLWKPFTMEVIRLINEKDNIVWVLWGRKAINYKKYITKESHATVCTSHPSPLSHYKPVGDYPAFTGSKCFEKVNDALDERNLTRIMW